MIYYFNEVDELLRAEQIIISPASRASQAERNIDIGRNSPQEDTNIIEIRIN
jgi:hypothetical protein